MTKKEIDLISSRGKGTYNQVYYDELGNRYIGLINGRIVRDQVSVANTATTATTAQNSITPTTSTTGSTGTVTSVQLTAGTGISLSGTNPITSSGNITVTNTDPDQIVSLGTTGTGLAVTGTYPNFTLQNTLPDQTVGFTNGTGISVTGTYPNFTITNTSPFTGAITSLNGLTASTQTFATGTTGSDFNISSSTSTHTFNIPDASASARGLITTAAQTLAGTKTFSSNPIFSSLTQGSVLFAGSGGLLSQSNLDFYWDDTNKRLRIGDSVTVSGLTTPSNSLVIYQTYNTSPSPSGSHSILLCGREYANPSYLDTNGVLFVLGANRPGNRQLWIGDSTALGNTGTGTGAKGFFRYLTGGALPSIDGIRGDGSVRLPVNIGTNTTNTAIGFEWTGATGTTLPASRLTIYGNLSVGNSYINIAAPTNGASIEGNVIIGTSTDNGYKLDVAGTARIQNKLTLGNSIIASGASEGTSGQVLTSNGIGAIPSWTTITSGGITTLNTLTATTQTFATGTSGTDFNISSATSTHTFNIPTASATNRGLLSSADWTTFNNKGNGTVTSVTGTSPIASSGGATPVISIADAVADGTTKGAATFTASDFNSASGVISIDYTNGQAASASNNGFLTSADWNIFNNKGSGTVTSVAALTLGTTGTDLSSSVATGSTTPVITLNVPTASATNRGVLSSTDWTAFNNKLSANQTITLSSDVTGSGSTSITATIASGAVTLAKMANLAANSIIGNNTGSAATPIALTQAQVTAMLNQFSSTLQGVVPPSGGGTTNFLRADGTWAAPAGGGGMSIGGSITSATAGSVLFAGTAGVLAQDNSNFFWDNTNKRLGIATASPTHKLHVSGSTTASAGSAIGAQFTPTLVAAANNDVLTGLNISPTFTNGAFTGLSNIGLRINNAFTFGVNASSGSGEIKSLATNVDFLGITGNTGTFNFYGGGAYNTGAGVTVGGNSHATYPNVIAFWRFNFVQNARFTAGGNLILGPGTADAGFKLDNSGTTRLQGNVTISDAINITVGSTTGTKIGLSSTEKLGFWNVTPVVQPTTATTAATRIAGAGATITDADTFDGYTIAKVVKALRNVGILQ